MTNSTVYEALGLARNPFPPTPDAGSYFFTPQLEEEFAEIRHCIESRKGFVLLTGEVGLGKSTMVRRLLDTLSTGSCRSALILNTFLQDSALLSAIQVDFGLPPSHSLEQGLAQLTEFLLSQHQKNGVSLLVIDDAQNLSVDSLELIRLLCNLETTQEKLLQILLVGQPELEHTLAQPALRQLKSRIVKHTRLLGLKKEELARYFDFRVNSAQAAGRLSINTAAVEELYKVTQGNLRQVHLVLDRCLYGLASKRQSVVDLPLLRRAVADIPSLENISNDLKNKNTEPKQRQFGWFGGVFAGLAIVVLLAWYGLYVPQNQWPNKILPLVNTQASSIKPTVGSEATGTQFSGSLAEQASIQQCEQKLKVIAHTEDSLVSQNLPSDMVVLLKPSPRLCISKINGQFWVTWLSRHHVHHIKAAEETTNQMQIFLKNMGFLNIQSPDGLFGPKTGEALLKFQQQYRLSPTGQPDDLTFFLLENLNAPIE